ncbi:ribonuclease H-like domain-containing protein [Tanacetum coccineum]
MASHDQHWYMDTRAIFHLSSHTGNLQTSFLNRNFHSVIVGNGSSIPVTHSGHVQILNPYRPLHLRNVLVTPNIIKNLVSVRKFTTDNKCSIDFDPYGFTVRDYHTRQTLLRCDSTGDLYPLHVVASAFALLTNNHSFWHQRLGHPGDAVIQTLSSRDENLDTSPIALRLLTTPTSPQQTPPQTTNPQTTPQIIPPTPLSTPSPQTTPTPPVTPPPPPTSKHPMVTRSKVKTVKTNPKYNFHVTTSSLIPKSPFQALREPNWKQAMCDEYKALIDNKTWVLVPRPPNVNIVRSMWLYEHKYNADGSLSRYKARIVTNGRSQQQDIDCDDTFSPVVKPATIRTVLSLAVYRQWTIHHLEVKNAFLHGHLTETVYMHQPPGFTDSAHSDYICLLQKSLYGLKQALRAWFQRFSSYAIRATSSTSLMQRIISSLHAKFAMTDLGPLNYFLGISATCTTAGIFLSQTKYAIEILERAQMLNCNPCWTLVDTEKKLGPEGSPITDLTLYRSLAGALQYLTFTRPDLSYAVQQLCLYMHDPREPHLNAMKRVLRYLRGTTDLGLQLFRSTTSQFIAYSDADWAGCPAMRRSTSGYCVYLGDNLLTWSSKRQDTLSRSSAETEYRGVANAVAKTSWIHNLLRELHTPLFTATLVYCDNVGRY